MGKISDIQMELSYIYSVRSQVFSKNIQSTTKKGGKYYADKV
jgi:hypothetical protein